MFQHRSSPRTIDRTDPPHLREKKVIGLPQTLGDRDMTGKICAAAALLTGLWAGSAQAALVVSTAATSNVSCSGGVCSATAANAVLNAHDLMVSLAHGDTTLVSGSIAQDIEFDTPVHWTSAQRLTLDSYHAITFTQPVMSEGTGGMTITVNDGGSGGDFLFTGKGRVAFWDTSSSLIINGNAYTLVNNIAGLSTGVTANPSGRFAFANNYDASVDGAYSQSPVSVNFSGTFEGLGNTISHLTINGCCALFQRVGSIEASGILRDIVLYSAVVRGGTATLVSDTYGNVIGSSSIGGMVSASSGGPNPWVAGGLIGTLDSGNGNVGSAIRSRSSTRVVCGTPCYAGGLVGMIRAEGNIKQSSASGSVRAGNNSLAGGLVGTIPLGLMTYTVIVQSFATGSVSVGNAVGKSGSVTAAAGGLVGYNTAFINEAYATGAVIGGSGLGNATNHVFVGGLVGQAYFTPTGTYKSNIRHSYATGSATVGGQGYAGGLMGAGPLKYTIQCYATGAVSVSSGLSQIGGFVGNDLTPGGNRLADDFWDLDTSGIGDPSKGAGNTADDPGITGLTTAQFQSGLPAGFDPTIWGESPGINNGLPYLLALQPQ